MSPRGHLIGHQQDANIDDWRSPTWILRASDNRIKRRQWDNSEEHVNKPQRKRMELNERPRWDSSPLKDGELDKILPLQTFKRMRPLRWSSSGQIDLATRSTYPQVPRGAHSMLNSPIHTRRQTHVQSRTARDQRNSIWTPLDPSEIDDNTLLKERLWWLR